MKRVSTLLLGAAMALALNAQAQTPEDIAAAQRAAEAWLSLADAGNYGQTWDDAAPQSQAMVAKAPWEAAIKTARTPLGALAKRTLQGADYSASLPGAPSGEYVVIRYSSDFAEKKGAVETVVPMRGTDGKWRVSGYFVR